MIDDEARRLLRRAAGSVPVSAAPVEGVFRQGRRLRRRRRFATTLGAAGTLAAVALVVSAGWLGIGGREAPGITGPAPSGGPAASGATHTQSTQGEVGALARRLVGYWRLRAIPGQPPLSSVSDGPVLLTIGRTAAPDEMRWTARQGCRRTGGTAHVSTEGRWTVWGAHMHDASCRAGGAGPLARRTTLAQTVESATLVRVIAGRLELVGGDGTTIAVLRRESAVPESTVSTAQ